MKTLQDFLKFIAEEVTSTCIVVEVLKRDEKDCFVARKHIPISLLRGSDNGKLLRITIEEKDLNEAEWQYV